jgi:hypothetical protein
LGDQLNNLFYGWVLNSEMVIGAIIKGNFMCNAINSNFTGYFSCLYVLYIVDKTTGKRCYYKPDPYEYSWVRVAESSSDTHFYMSVISDNPNIAISEAW